MPGTCCKKKKGKKKRKHTPPTSKAQLTAMNIAHAAEKGKFPVSKLKGASRQMYKGMTGAELQSHTEEGKHLTLPQYVAERKRQKNRRAG
jgi:hypothetical protein